MGLGLTTPGSRVTCSAEWASQAPQFDGFSFYVWVCDPFQVNGCVLCKIRVKYFYFPHTDIWLLWCHFLKRLSLRHWITLLTLSKINWHRCVGLFLDSLLCSAENQYHTISDYCSFMDEWTLSFKYTKPFNLVLFFKIVLPILGPLKFHLNFRIILSVSTEKSLVEFWLRLLWIYRPVWGELTL